MVRRVERVGSSSFFSFCFSLGVGVFLGVGLGVAGVVSLEVEESVFVVVVEVSGADAGAWAWAGLRRGDLNGLVSVDEGDDLVLVFRRRRLGLGVGVWFGFIVCLSDGLLSWVQEVQCLDEVDVYLGWIVGMV